MLLLLANFPTPGAAAAQADEESELINLIGTLRASRGLDAYIVDPGLMEMAREHSAYQASIHQSTHQHSDGRVPPEIGVVENVAEGDLGYITTQNVIFDIWSMDYGHLKTMVGYRTGTMGVGVANDGEIAYYTLEVRPEGMTPVGDMHSAGEATPTPYTPIPLIPLVTLTPRPDGAIIHKVGYGQTLWSIALAYGVTINQLRGWNYLPAGSTDIYAGQGLLIVLPTQETPIPVTGQNESTARPSAQVTQTTAPRPTATQTEMPTPAQPPQTAAPISRDYSASAEETTSPILPIAAGFSILAGCFLFVLARMLMPRRRFF